MLWGALDTRHTNKPNLCGAHLKTAHASAGPQQRSFKLRSQQMTRRLGTLWLACDRLRTNGRVWDTTAETEHCHISWKKPLFGLLGEEDNSHLPGGEVPHTVRETDLTQLVVVGLHTTSDKNSNNLAKSPLIRNGQNNEKHLFSNDHEVIALKK